MPLGGLRIVIVATTTLLLLIVGGLLLYHFTDSGPDLFSVEGDQFIVKGRESKGFASYTITGEKQILTGNFLQYALFSGKVDRFGQLISLNYLDPEGYKIFQEQYGGILSNCPASFLNTYTKVVVLYAANQQVAEQLIEAGKEFPQGRVKMSDLPHSSIPFKVSGRPLHLNEAQLEDGRPVNVNFGNDLLFLVDEVIKL